MLLPRALRDSLFRFRKRKQRSLDSILGSDRAGPIIHADPMFEQSMVTPAYDPHQELYMFDFPGEYVADPGPMEISANDYDPYAPAPGPNWHGNQEKIRGFTMAALGLARPHEVVTYEDGLMDKESFTLMMEIILQRELDPMLRESSMEASQVFDHHEIFSDISKDQIQEILAFQRAANAQLSVIDPLVTQSESFYDDYPLNNIIPHAPVPVSSEPLLAEIIPQQTPVGVNEYFAHDLRQSTDPMIDTNFLEIMNPPDYIERQMQMFDRQFQEPQHLDDWTAMDTMFQRQEAVFDAQQAESLEEVISPDVMQPANPMLPLNVPLHHDHEMLEPEQTHLSSLEQTLMEPIEQSQESMPQSMDYGMQPYMNPLLEPDVPQYEDGLMTPETFNHMLQEANDPMEQQDPMPGPDPYDNGMMPYDMYDPQQMYNPQMQEMMPDMMPGPPGP